MRSARSSGMRGSVLVVRRWLWWHEAAALQDRGTQRGRGFTHNGTTV
jgi:hypothetical protein